MTSPGHTAIRFSPEVKERLRAEAEARGVSVNWLVNRAVERMLRDLIPIEEWSLTRD